MCRDCPKRPFCTSLCPEAELYADQDQVEWEETPRYYDGMRIMRRLEKRRQDEPDELTLRERQLVQLKWAGFTVNEICQLLEIVPSTYRTHLMNIRKKVQKILH